MDYLVNQSYQIKAQILYLAKIVNDIVGPIKTEFGYNIYKIVDIIPKNKIKYKEALKILRKKY